MLFKVVEVVIMACGIIKVKVLSRRLSVKSILLAIYNVVLQFLHYRRRNKRHRETVVSMLSCGALERSNNPYIESTVEPFVSKNQKGIACVCVCEREKNKSFEIHVIILRYIRNVKLKKDFKFAELLTKISFSFTLETVLKMANETN